MKTQIKNKIKLFLKNQKSKNILPFLAFSEENNNTSSILVKNIELLPKVNLKEGEDLSYNNILTQKHNNSPFLTKITDNFLNDSIKVVRKDNKNNKELNLETFFVNKKSPTIKIGSISTIKNTKSGRFSVKLSNKDKKSLVEMIQNKKINNKLEKISNNEFQIVIPAYATGKFSTLFPTFSKITDKLKENGSSSARKTIVNSLENINATLDPTAKTAGGQEEAKVTVLGQNTSNPEAALIGESGKEIVENNNVIPVEKIEEIYKNKQQNDDKKQTSADIVKDVTSETEVLSKLGPVGDVLKKFDNFDDVIKDKKCNVSEECKEENSNKSNNESKAVGKPDPSDPSITLGKIDQKISGVSSLGGGLGSVGKSAGGIMSMMAGGLPGLGLMGGPIGLAAAALAPAAIGAVGSLASGAGEALGSVASGVGSGIGSIASGIGAGVGSAISGVGSLVGGIGKALMQNSPAGMLMDKLLGNDENEENKKGSAAVIQDNRVNQTNMTNILYQYDIYRKTADDNFMLPNYRREYG